MMQTTSKYRQHFPDDEGGKNNSYDNPFDNKRKVKEKKEAALARAASKKKEDDGPSLRLPSISPVRSHQSVAEDDDIERKKEKKKRKKEKEKRKRDREKGKEKDKQEELDESLGGTSLNEYFTGTNNSAMFSPKSANAGGSGANDSVIGDGGSSIRLEGPDASGTDKERKKRKKQQKKEKRRHDAAISIQRRIRGLLGRARFKKLHRKRQFARAKAAGVLLAVDGTVQGESGWYQQDETSLPVYYEVMPNGQWRLVM